MTTGTSADERNYGIDALRLLAMLFIVVLHILEAGGVLAASAGSRYAAAGLLEIIVYSAVNIFAVISGYVGFTQEKKPYRFSRYGGLWLQIFTYSFGITLIALLLGRGGATGQDLVDAAFPVTTGRYWYFCAYTGLFFLAPWLNALVRACTPRRLTGLVAVFFLVFSCYASIAALLPKDPFSLKGGYSFLWLALLYVYGAWMKKCGVPERIKSGTAAAVGCGCLVLTGAVRLFVPSAEPFFLSYISPTILLPALCWVVLFARIRVGGAGQKLLRLFAPASFGVYLIHVHKVFWTRALFQRFSWIAGLPAWLLPLTVIGCGAAIFLACLLVERLRIFLFRSLRITAVTDRFFALLERWGRALCDKLIRRIDP